MGQWPKASHHPSWGCHSLGIYWKVHCALGMENTLRTSKALGKVSIWLDSQSRWVLKATNWVMEDPKGHHLRKVMTAHINGFVVHLAKMAHFEFLSPLLSESESVFD